MVLKQLWNMVGTLLNVWWFTDFLCLALTLLVKIPWYIWSVFWQCSSDFLFGSIPRIKVSLDTLNSHLAIIRIFSAWSLTCILLASM
jgi:hypothetical protein